MVFGLLGKAVELLCFGTWKIQWSEAPHVACENLVYEVEVELFLDEERQHLPVYAASTQLNATISIGTNTNDGGVWVAS